MSVLVVACLFIAASVWQIAAAVFYERPARAAPRTAEEIASETACTARLRTLEAALDRGAEQAERATVTQPKPDESRARAAFDAALAPEWNDSASAEQLCAATPRSRDAWAALLRLRRGLEGIARKDAHEIGPLRRDFETRLP